MENDFEETMGNIETPKTDFIKHHEMLKIGLMNARKSSRIGLIFILVPLLVMAVAFIKFWFLSTINYQTTVGSILEKANQSGNLVWLVLIAFIVLPVSGIIINLLAITHFYINKTSKELVVTFQYRLKNLIVLIISFVLLLSFVTFIIIGNVHFK